MKLQDRDIVFKNIKPFGLLFGIAFQNKIVFNLCGTTMVLPKFLMPGFTVFRLKQSHPDQVTTVNYLLSNELKGKKIISLNVILALFKFNLGLSSAFISKIYKVIDIQFSGGKRYVYPADLEFDDRFERIK